MLAFLAKNKKKKNLQDEGMNGYASPADKATKIIPDSDFQPVLKPTKRKSETAIEQPQAKKDPDNMKVWGNSKPVDAPIKKFSYMTNKTNARGQGTEWGIQIPKPKQQQNRSFANEQGLSVNNNSLG